MGRVTWLCLLLCGLIALSTIGADDPTDEETGQTIDHKSTQTGDDMDDDATIGGDDMPPMDDDMPPMDDDMPDDFGGPPPGGDDEPVAEEKPVEPIDYETPTPEGFYYFADPFVSKSGIGRKWHKSTAKKDGADDSIAKYDGEWSIDLPDKVALRDDYGLIVMSKAHHHAIAAKMDRPFTPNGKPLVVQFEVKYQEGQECGGGYVKLLSPGAEKDLAGFGDTTPYTIMFGPDKCGMTSKVHFILRVKNPNNNTISEHHAKQGTKTLDEYFSDHKSHLYTLVVNPDNTYKVLIDQTEFASGNLLKDLEPEIAPPKEIADPDDKKPEDWDDREKIADPDAKKPDDWDEDAPKEIEDADATKPDDWNEDEEPDMPDPEAKKPDDWDTEMDGEWEAKKIKNPKCEGLSGCGPWKRPMKKNPDYKGKWKAPKITNPSYKGKWAPRMIENPNYFEVDPYKQMTGITALGIELWTMSEKILFDNFLVTDSQSTADAFATKTWTIKSKQENLVIKATSPKSDGFIQKAIAQAEERPWLWAVYILIVLIPVVLITVFCFGGSKDKTAEAKKTDKEVVDDDDAEGEDDDEQKTGDDKEENKSDTDGDKQTRRRRSSRGKAALEEDDDETAGAGGDAPEPHDSPGRRLRQRRQD